MLKVGTEMTGSGVADENSEIILMDQSRFA